MDVRIRTKTFFLSDVNKKLSIYKELYLNIELEQLTKYVYTQILLSSKYGSNNKNLVEYLNKVRFGDLSPKLLNIFNNINVYLHIGDESRQDIYKDSQLENLLKNRMYFLLLKIDS